MEKYDYKALEELIHSAGWKILTNEVETRILDIEEVILSPTTEDMLGTDDPVKQMNLLAYKKAERIYLKSLLDMPHTLLASKIKINQK